MQTSKNQTNQSSSSECRPTCELTRSAGNPTHRSPPPTVTCHGCQRPAYCHRPACPLSRHTLTGAPQVTADTPLICRSG